MIRENLKRWRESARAHGVSVIGILLTCRAAIYLWTWMLDCKRINKLRHHHKMTFMIDGMITFGHSAIYVKDCNLNKTHKLIAGWKRYLIILIFTWILASHTEMMNYKLLILISMSFAQFATLAHVEHGEIIVATSSHQIWPNDYLVCHELSHQRW